MSRAVEAVHSEKVLIFFSEDTLGANKRIPCFVDDAQTLLEKLHEGFPSTSDNTRRCSCFSVLVKAL
ncbi:hypothetical protein ACYT69_11210, partial [Streptococcus pyogenes]